MENLYRVDEYSGILPNPMSFPLKDSTIIAIIDKPTAFSDGFMLDLFIRESDVDPIKQKVIRTIGTGYLSNLLEEGRVSNVLLSEPEFIYDVLYLTYILFTHDNHPIGIQVKYYNYFRNRYKTCKFYIRDSIKDNIMIPIMVKLDDELVGVCMRIALDTTAVLVIKQLKEEGR